MTAPGSGYELFGERKFRNVWTANLVFNLGLVMLNLGVAWTMTSLTDSPLLVSMVQTASSLPFILFAIPLGVATDSVGHRRMMIASQVWMLGVPEHATDRHLQILSELAQMFSERAFREQLAAAASPAQAHAVIRDWRPAG
jgi:MFS family permease